MVLATLPPSMQRRFQWKVAVALWVHVLGSGRVWMNKWQLLLILSNMSRGSRLLRQIDGETAAYHLLSPHRCSAEVRADSE